MNAPSHDPALPGLAHALERQRMAVAFEDFFRRECPGRELAVRECRVEAVRHRPGKRCRISYVLSGRDVDGGFERHLTCNLLAEGRSPESYLAAVPETVPGCAPWRPAFWWPEMRMLIQVFPYDPELPELGSLLEPESVKREVQRRLDAWGWSPPWRTEGVQVRVLKYRPGRRCVIRYEASLGDARGGRSRVAFFGKTYPGPESRYVHDALVAIQAGLEASDRDFEVPRPLAHLDELNTLWQQAWPGEGPRSRAERVGWPSFLDSGALPGAAGLLASIHRLTLPPGLLRSASDTGFLMDEARDNLDHIRRFEPALAGTLERSIAQLSAARPVRPAPTATLHGSFKLAQLLCRDEALTVIDFDGVSAGDPHLDLGEFAASLLHLEMRDGVDLAHVDAARERFLDTYAAAAPWPCDRARVAWYTAIFLLAKLHSRLKKHDRGGLERLPTALERLDAEARRAAGAP